MTTRDELLREIADSLLPPGIDREGGWFTVKDLMPKFPEKSYGAVAAMLETKAQLGVLEKSQGLGGGRIVNCYKKR